MLDELGIRIRGDLGELAQVNELITALLQRHATRVQAANAPQLAIEEVLSNVIRHRYDAAPGDQSVSSHMKLDNDGVHLEFVDDGRAFDPLSVPEVDCEASLEDRRVGGLGVHLLRTMTRHLAYERKAGRNHLRVHI